MPAFLKIVIFILKVLPSKVYLPVADLLCL
jgi:hypothetical protein